MSNVDNLKNTLTGKVVRGSIWLAALQVISQIMIVLRLIILARLLSPADFGILGIGLMVITTLEALSQTGINQALIQKKGPIRHFFNEAWSVMLLRGLILSTIVIAVAPFISDFFLHNNDAITVIRFLGILFIIQAFSNIGLVEIQKELEFNKHFIHQFSITAADFFISVAMALVFRNIWALVAGMLSGALVGCFVSYLIHPFRPSFVVSLHKIRGLLSFGKWNTGSSICMFIGGNIDNIIVGRVLGPSMLGFYQLAFKISNLPATEISYVLGRAAFPAYAKLQDRKEDLKIAFTKVLKMIQLLALPIALMIIIMAKDFTAVFLGDKWMPMVPAMRLLAVGAIAKSIVSTGTYLFIGSGSPEKDFYMQLVRALLLAAAVYPLTYYFGIEGTSVGVIFSLAGMWVVWYVNISVILSARMKEYWRLLYPPLAGSVCMALIVLLLKNHLVFSGDLMLKSILSFAVTGLAGAMVYFVSLYLVRLVAGNESSIDDFRMIGRIIRKS